MKCPHRRSLPLERRPANALNVEPIQPLDRCMMQCPDGRGAAWSLSGGSILAYGMCTRRSCPVRLDTSRPIADEIELFSRLFHAAYKARDWGTARKMRAHGLKMRKAAGDPR